MDCFFFEALWYIAFIQSSHDLARVGVGRMTDPIVSQVQLMPSSPAAHVVFWLAIGGVAWELALRRVIP